MIEYTMADINYISNPSSTGNKTDIEGRNVLQNGKKDSKQFIRSDHTPTTAASNNKRDNL